MYLKLTETDELNNHDLHSPIRNKGFYTKLNYNMILIIVHCPHELPIIIIQQSGPLTEQLYITQ